MKLFVSYLRLWSVEEATILVKGSTNKLQRQSTSRGKELKQALLTKHQQRFNVEISAKRRFYNCFLWSGLVCAMVFSNELFQSQDSKTLETLPQTLFARSLTSWERNEKSLGMQEFLLCTGVEVLSVLLVSFYCYGDFIKLRRILKQRKQVLGIYLALSRCTCENSKSAVSSFFFKVWLTL